MGTKKCNKAIQWNTKKDNCIGWESMLMRILFGLGVLNFLADET